MKNLLFLLPLLGLASCTAPKDTADATGAKPEETKRVYHSSRFGRAVWYTEVNPETPKEKVTEKKPVADPEPVKTTASADSVAPTTTQTPPAASKKPLFSFLAKKPKTAEDPKAKPAPPVKPAPIAAPAVTPAPRKPLFSFLMKKEPPKALVVQPPPSPKKNPTQATKVKDMPAELPKPEDDGLRLPDMLTMPEKNEFESTNPSATKPQGGGAVIARPPTDPPSRPKTKENP